METIEVKLTKEDLIDTIKKYYKEKEGKEVEPKVRTYKDESVYGDTIYMSEVVIPFEIDLGITKTTYEQSLSEDVVKEILSNYIKNVELNKIYMGSNGISLFVTPKDKLIRKLINIQNN